MKRNNEIDKCVTLTFAERFRSVETSRWVLINAFFKWSWHYCSTNCLVLWKW